MLDLAKSWAIGNNYKVIQKNHVPLGNLAKLVSWSILSFNVFGISPVNFGILRSLNIKYVLRNFFVIFYHKKYYMHNIQYSNFVVFQNWLVRCQRHELKFCKLNTYELKFCKVKTYEVLQIAQQQCTEISWSEMVY